MLNNLIKPYLYVNSQHLEISMKHSVYDLTVSGDTLFIADFRNNKVTLADLRDGNVQSSFQVKMPHGITATEDTVYVCTHRENSVLVKRSDHERLSRSHYLDHPVSIVKCKDFVVIANWGSGNAGNLLLTDSDLTDFNQFTTAWTNSKPHAVRVNKQDQIIVAYRFAPGLVIFDSNGLIVAEKLFSDHFDPLSVASYKSCYLVPNGFDGHIYVFDAELNYLTKLYGGGHGPTNLAVWGNKLFVSEESANRVLAIQLDKIFNN